MRNVLLFTLFLVMPLAQGTSVPKSEADYLEAAKVDLAFTKNFISTKFCYSDGRVFKACRDAFFQLADYLGRLQENSQVIAIAKQGAGERPHFDSILVQLDGAETKSKKAFIYGRLVNFLLGQFDAHSKIWTNHELNMVSDMNREFGLGADLEANGAGLFVRFIHNDSAAFQSGLTLHDQILEINGQAVGVGMDAVRASHKLSQPANSSHIDLLIERGLKKISVRVRPSVFSIPMLESEKISSGKFNIGYVRMSTFGEDACFQLENKIFELQPIDGLILDIRSNPGGQVNEANCIGSLFVGRKLMRYERKISLLPQSIHLIRSKQETRSIIKQENDAIRERPTFVELPLIILTNAKTASAGEYVAAALQDYGAAWVVGERTFGKGTAQFLRKVGFNNKVLIAETHAESFRPTKQSLHIQGVTPNFSVPASRTATALERKFLREADLFTTGNFKRKVTNWSDPRARQVEELKKCADHRADGLDYQKSYALAVLLCSPLGEGPETAQAEYTKN